jgi:molybdopterin molybdotransferase
MLDFEVARARILQQARPLETLDARLTDALGRVLAEDVSALRDLPEAETSAMDGYAVRVAELPGPGPWQVPVEGESRAGAPLGELAPGHACRIFTGALVPNGADAVILQEDVERNAARISFTERPAPGQHVRATGSDLRAGALGLCRGTRLTAFSIGALAAFDRERVKVSAAPRVTILCTGDELRPPGSPHRRGTIPESNGAALSAMVRCAGGVAQVAALVKDDEATTREQLDRAMRDADLVLTVGGVSVGDRDVVREALSNAGATIDFWKVKIKPGKPLVFASRGDCLVLGLPGNPVSAQVTFGLFGLPLLRQMQSDNHVLPRMLLGKLAEPLRQKPGRMGFHRVRFDGEHITPLGNQSSGSILSLAEADALAVVPADSHGFDAGDTVPLMPLREL